jgi:hypothetical protein
MENLAKQMASIRKQNISDMKSREEAGKGSAFGTRINFEKKNELKISFNSQDSKHSKNLNGISFAPMPSVLIWIETLINRPGLIKNCRTNRFPRPDQGARCGLFAHQTLFCHLNSIHPVAIRFHRPLGETARGLKLLSPGRMNDKLIPSSAEYCFTASWQWTAYQSKMSWIDWLSSYTPRSDASHRRKGSQVVQPDLE